MIDLRAILTGSTSAAGEVTLRASQATTVVEHFGVSSTSHITLTPLTANAAADYGAGTFYISARGKNTFTITHANNANADKTFYWGAWG
jgi:hypothetical protein